MAEELRDVVGVGNAIVDVLVETDDAFLETQGLVKGAMTLIDANEALALYSATEGGVECSGGSAANTMAGIASFGGAASYIGKVRDDGLGKVFRTKIDQSGVSFETLPATNGPPTARCVILVTPDAQRTMQTFLGAAAALEPEDIDPSTIEGCRVVYLEGYLWDPPPAKQAFLKAAEIAHRAGRRVALSLSDAFCVDRHRAELQEFVRDHVDLLFANEDEIISLFEASNFDEAVRMITGQCEVAALTRGKQGSAVVSAAGVIEVPAAPVERVVDTTGAGDLYASGFLFGFSHDLGPGTCAKLGGIAAAEVISHFGARPAVSLSDLIRGMNLPGIGR